MALTEYPTDNLVIYHTSPNLENTLKKYIWDERSKVHAKIFL